VLREDNRAIVRAASQATKAADYLLGFLPETATDRSTEPGGSDREAA
jgi:antirestriction protein ArdC